LEQKYEPILVEQRKLAAKELEKRIKRMSRDDPDFYKELPL
jgi:hypothetical protein